MDRIDSDFSKAEKQLNILSSSPLMPEGPMENFYGEEQFYSRQDTDNKQQQVKFETDGYSFKEFNFRNRTFTVERRLRYDKWWHVIGKPIATRKGEYILRDEKGFKYSARILDYSAYESRNWKLFMLELKLIKEDLASSLLTNVSPEISTEGVQATSPVGGIDFRAMNYLVQPMGSFKDLRFGLPTLTSSVLERIDLDKELGALRNMVKAGMVPSGERVKEYLAACFQKGKIEEKQDDLLVCLAEIYRLAEEENLETSPELRESLVIVDTGRFVLLPNNQKVGLN